MSKYMYRAEPGYTVGSAIKCSDTNSKATIDDHVSWGSKIDKSGNKKFKSKYISCTKNIGVATIYSLGPTEKLSSVRQPVVLINLEELSKNETNIYDLTDAETRKENLYSTLAIKYAPASQEVIVENEIPSQCIKRIPTLFVDILQALECCKYDSNIGNNSKYSPKLYDIITETLCDMIMKDDINIANILSNMEFSEIEKHFIKDYYCSSKPISEKELSEKYFSGNMEVTECMRVKIVKDVVKSMGFRGMIYNELSQNKNIMSELSEKEVQNMFVLLAGKKVNPIEQYVGLMDDEMPLTSKKTDSTKCVFGGAICKKVPVDSNIFLPYGAEIDLKNPNKIITKTIKITKERSEKLQVNRNIDGSLKEYTSEVQVEKNGNHDDYDDFGVL